MAGVSLVVVGEGHTDMLPEWDGRPHARPRSFARPDEGHDSNVSSDEVVVQDATVHDCAA